MSRDVRHEFRYFFSSRFFSLVKGRLESIAEQQEYANPITSTVYFLPAYQRGVVKTYTRLRFYSSSTEKTLSFLGDGFLEIKRTNKDGLVIKDRHVVQVNEAFSSLVNGSVDELLGPLANLHGSFTPMVGMSVRRSHWLTVNARLTLDHNIRVFGFVGKKLSESECIATLNEDKVEIKSSILLNLPEELRRIFGGVSYHAETCAYLEGRLRSCYQQWHQGMLCK